MNHLAYGRDVPITSWPDPNTVPCLVYGPTYDGHTGVDAFGSYAPYGSRVPLYAMSDGIVVGISTPENPNNRYASYPSSGLSPAIRAGDMVWRIGHFAECVVSVGEWVHKGQHIGYQGWTGNVDPPGPNGTHSHTSVYYDPQGQAKPKLVDPVPYCNGKKAFPASPKPEVTEMFDIPPTLYKYTDTPANIRVNPGTSGLLTGKKVATGAQITITALAAADGYIWGRIPDGWVAIAQGKTAWAVPASQYPDLSGKVTALETAITAANAKVSTLTTERDRARAAINAAISTLEAGK